MTRSGMKLFCGVVAMLAAGIAPSHAQAKVGPQGPEDGAIRRQAWLVPAQDRTTMMRTTLFRPPGAGPFPLAVINHGSTQNELRRATAVLPLYPVLTEWLVSRGYAVAIPQRPGHGATGGPYYETQGGCADADFAKAGQAAASSIAAAIGYLTQQRFVRKTGVVAFGHSAGGWGALALAGRGLRSLAGVVAFAPGLGGRVNDMPGRNCAPDRLIEAARGFGGKARVPTLWLAAENDGSFAPALSRRLAEAFRLAGGRAEYHLLPAIGADGHDLIRAPEAVTVWGPIVERFLKTVR
jgi:dienelactone hydrolase